MLSTLTYINPLIYADDIVIMRQTKDQLRKTIFILNDILQDFRLMMSAQKQKFKCKTNKIMLNGIQVQT